MMSVQISLIVNTRLQFVVDGEMCMSVHVPDSFQVARVRGMGRLSVEGVQTDYCLNYAGQLAFHPPPPPWICPCLGGGMWG